jgi:hypothetical protein
MSKAIIAASKKHESDLVMAWHGPKRIRAPETAVARAALRNCGASKGPMLRGIIRNQTAWLGSWYLA